jgi:hypothetical protein
VVARTTPTQKIKLERREADCRRAGRGGENGINSYRKKKAGEEIRERQKKKKKKKDAEEYRDARSHFSWVSLWLLRAVSLEAALLLPTYTTQRTAASSFK